MFRHRHTTLCPEGWCFLLLIGAILLLAIIRDENLMLIVAGMLIAPLWLNWYLARRNLRHVSVQRELAGDARAGGWLRVHLCVRNDRRRLAPQQQPAGSVCGSERPSPSHSCWPLRFSRIY